jgi:hypothetical protein
MTFNSSKVAVNFYGIPTPLMIARGSAGYWPGVGQPQMPPHIEGEGGEAIAGEGGEVIAPEQ